MTTALVIGRRRPGRPIAAAVQEARRLLEAAGWSVESAVVKRKKAMRRRVKAAVKASTDIVVAVGGDGAVLQAVQRVATTDVALGIVPMGTGNLLATNLGIPRSLEKAVQVIVEGGRRQIDVGRVTVGSKERCFSVACGVGFDAKVMEATKTRDKRRLGKLAYALRAIRDSGSLRDVQQTLVIDGRRTSMRAAQVLVANFGRSGLGVEPVLPIAPDDGQLDLLALRAPGRASGLLAIWEAIRQPDTGRTRSGRVLRARGRHIEISTRRKLPVEIDGSVVGTTPITITVEPGALRVLVPTPTVSPEAPSG